MASFLGVILLLQFNPIQILELKIVDKFFENRGSLDVSESPIVLVAISQQADEEIPQKYPWPTNLHAKLVENLNKAGAKVIAFDVIFDNRDSYNLANDTLFAKSLQKYGNVILAGELQRSEFSLADEISTIFPNRVLMEYNPNRVGLVRVVPDLDGAVRSYHFGNRHMNTQYYRLGIEVIRAYKGIPYNQVDDESQSKKKSTFSLGPFEIPKDRANSFLINYYGPEGIFPTVSYDEVIDDSSYTTVFEMDLGDQINSFDDPEIGHLSKGTFKDKVVIVGATMPTLKDFYATPFANRGDNPRPGFEIHANAIQTILDGNYINRASAWIVLAIIWMICLLITLINRYKNASWGVTFSLLLMVAYVGLAYWAFIQVQTLFMITGPLLAIVLTQGGMVSYEYYVEQKEKRRIKQMFASYVSPELVNRMIRSGEEPQLGGEETYLTAFFSDIVSFSTFSEQLEAKELVKLINEYLSAMTDVLTQQGGTLDKYIGDAIVAFFGSPVPIQNHALQACISSQLMHKQLEELREKWKKDGWPEIVTNMEHRIGMNTGLMITGNMGSTRRFNYTMMGDNVNIAARCESGAQAYGVKTMVTEATKLEAEKYGKDCVFRRLDNIVVKGRSAPVKVYEILCLRDDLTQQFSDCKGLYEEGLNLYLDQKWEPAVAKFTEAYKLEKYEINPSGIFIERCKMMEENPPKDNWDGVFVMKSK